MPADLAYGALLEAFGDDVQAIAKDLEVYAGPEPPPDYTLEYEIDGVLRAAKEAGFERFHLVGYSGGGASSLAFAASHPERLLSLALLEPAWMGNEGLSPEEQAVWREFDRIATLPPDQMMAAFVASQLAPGVEPPPPPPGPPPPWMATRPAGLRAFIATFRSSRCVRGAPPFRPASPDRARAYGAGAAGALGTGRSLTTNAALPHSARSRAAAMPSRRRATTRTRPRRRGRESAPDRP
jgi:pimeloyl-ACP methyl ester carboxylesterase